MIASHDYDRLSDQLKIDLPVSPEEANRRLNWLKVQEVHMGQGLFVRYYYAAWLWRAGSLASNPAEAAGLKQSAVQQLYSADYLIKAEGFQCAANDAAPARYELINAQLAAIPRYAESLDAQTKANLQNGAYLLTALGFRDRHADDWMCRGGSGYLAKYIRAHPEDHGMETSPPGAAQKQVRLGTDPALTPDYVPVAAWREKRLAALKAMGSELGVSEFPKAMLDPEPNPGIRP